MLNQFIKRLNTTKKKKSTLLQRNGEKNKGAAAFEKYFGVVFQKED